MRSEMKWYDWFLFGSLALLVAAMFYALWVATLEDTWFALKRWRANRKTAWLRYVIFDKGDYVRWNDPVEIGLERAGTCVQPTLTIARIPQWAVGIVPKFLWFIFDIRPVIEQEILGDDGKTYSISERELCPTVKGAPHA